jgi:cell division initiation protein
MDMLPEEIRKQNFKTQLFGGFDKEEVKKYLMQLTRDYQKIILKNEELQRGQTIAFQEMERFKKLEGTLLYHIEELKKEKEILKKEKEEATQQYEKAARIKLIEAEAEAKRIIDKAKKNAEDILSEAHKNSQEKIERMRHDLKTLEYNYNVVESHSEKLIGEMLGLIEDSLDKIQKLSITKKIAMTEDKILKTNKLLTEATLRKSKQFTDKSKENKEENSTLKSSSISPLKTIAYAQSEEVKKDDNEQDEKQNGNSLSSFFDQFN